VTRKHDLDAILGEVLMHFTPLSKQIHIDWVDLDECDAVDFDEHRDFACAIDRTPGLFVGVHPKLRHAPRYVLRYLVSHEVLHLAFGVFNHPPVFDIADRLLPGYVRANAWLEAFEELGGLA
jgi:hypothetical protein